MVKSPILSLLFRVLGCRTQDTQTSLFFFSTTTELILELNTRSRVHRPPVGSTPVLKNYNVIVDERTRNE